MSALAKIAAFFKPAMAPPARTLPPPRLIRMEAYEATSSKPRVADWDQTAYGPNSALELGQVARARSQDAVRNNPWIRRAVKLLVSHLIGCGIQPRPKIADRALRTDLLALWNDWTAEADADGVMGFYGLQSLLSRARYESGEVFIRLRWRLKSDGLSVPLQLQMIESDLLPLGMNEPSRRIRQGIERDGIGKRIAYHFYREHPGERFVLAAANNTSRVPADEVLHHYLPDRPGQLRGAPEGLSTLYRARNLDQYESAELTRKRNKARFTGVIRKEQPEDNPIADGPANPVLADLQRQLATLEASADYLANDPTAVANAAVLREQITVEQEKKVFVDIEDGYMLQLAMGESAEFPGGDTGNNALLDFMRAQLRGMAAGWGIPYELMVNDYADTNDRVLRVILNVFYRELEAEQDHFIYQVLQPIYASWLTTAVLSGALDIPGYFANPRAFQRCEWRAHAWTYVNPLQEVQTKILKIRNGLSSRTAEIAGDGWDAEDIDQQNSDDEAREQRLGLDYGGDLNTAPDTAPADTVQTP